MTQQQTRMTRWHTGFGHGSVADDRTFLDDAMRLIDPAAACCCPSTESVPGAKLVGQGGIPHLPVAITKGEASDEYPK